MIMGTLSITHMVQPVFLLGSLASGDLGEKETRSHLCLFPWFQRKVLMRGRMMLSHTWPGPRKHEVGSFSERRLGKEAPRDNIFHLLLLKCVGLEM